MIKNVVEQIGGVGLYGIISISLFFTVFTGALIWALLQKKAFLNLMSVLPLEDGTESTMTKGDNE